MSDLTDLQTIKTQIIARIKEVTAHPKPTYEIEGQRVEWSQYLGTLRKELKDIMELIALQEPFAEETQGFTPDV